MGFVRLTGFVVMYNSGDFNCPLPLGNMAFPSQESAKAAAEKAGIPPTQYTLYGIDFFLPGQALLEMPEGWRNEG